MRKLASRRTTHPLIWCAAIICAIISVAVIFAGIVVFIGYVVIHPRVPVLSVVDAHLDVLRYDIAGTLQTQITIIIQAKNDNAEAHATFYDTSFKLRFDGKDIAVLMAPMFEVNKNSSLFFHYVAQSYPVPLGPTEMQAIDQALKQDLIVFKIEGSSRARWRVGPLGSVKFWLNLNCNLQFRPSDFTYLPSPCSSSHKHR